jgi:hypothetical protein
MQMVQEIEFRLSMGKTEYLLGEPAVAYLELSNSGTQSVPVIDQLDPKLGIVKFYIKSGSEETIFRPYVVADSMPRTSLLNPGTLVSGDAKIFYGGKGWTFKSVGKYQIRATYNGLVSNPKEELNSNVVEVNIRSPENKQEKDQVSLIMGDEQGLFLLFEAGDHLSKGIRSLTELTRKYPQSDLAGYANIALGRNYSKDFKDFQRGFVRKADTERSLLHLKSAKDRNVDSYFARQAYLTLAKIYEDSNLEDAKKETLNEYIERFSRDSKHADSIKKAKSMLEELD